MRRRNVRKAFLHGLYVGATGDLTKLRQIRLQAETSSIVNQAWESVGQSMRQASEQIRDDA